MSVSRIGPLVGAERPRVELRPAAAVDSLVEEAVELATRAGIPPEPWQVDGLEIMLSLRADGSWAARNYAEILGRQQGKTGGLGIPRVLVGLFLLDERLLIWTAHQYNTALETFLQVHAALLNLGEEIRPNVIEVADEQGPIHIKVSNTNGDEGFELVSRPRGWRKRLRFLARSPRSGRGFTGDVNIVDEAFAYTAAQQAALAPTALARPNAQTIYLSSPPLKGDEGRVLYRLRTRAEQGDQRLGFRDWGLALPLDEFMRWPEAQRREFLRDRANWAATLPALGRGRVTEEAVEALLDELADDADAAREVLCMWPVHVDPAAAKTAISKAAWAARAGTAGPPAERIGLAVAASWPDARTWSIGLAGRRAEDLVPQLVDRREGMGWVVERLKALAVRLPGVPVAIDPGGPAGRVIAPARDAGLNVVTPTLREVAHASQALRDEVDGPAPTLKHFVAADIDDPELAGLQRALDSAVTSAGWRLLETGGTWHRRGEVDTAPVEAISLAAWVGEAHAPAVALSPVSAGSSSTTTNRSETGDLMRIGF